MAVRGGLFVNRPKQIQVVDDRRRSKIENFGHGLGDLLFGEPAGTKRFHQNAHRAGDADRIGDLHLATIGDPGGNDIFGDPAGGVRAGAIDFRGILSQNAPPP